jgi:ABC-type dipeptide/oligopeptide/nickel transport system ATPase component
MAEPLLDIQGLRTVFRTAGGEVAAVDGIDLSVPRGGTLGFVGESGCGKSVLSLSIMRLVPRPGRVAAGRVLLATRDLLALGADEMRRVRGGQVAMIFQEPMTSLNRSTRPARRSSRRCGRMSRRSAPRSARRLAGRRTASTSRPRRACCWQSSTCSARGRRPRFRWRR